MGVLESAWLGTLAYDEGLALQSSLHDRRASGEIGDTLLQLEHPNVFTIGRRGSRGDVLWDAATLSERHVEVVEADRGGQVTYHGPGQLVGYPIIDLGPGADLVKYIRNLEAALIATLATWGVEGERSVGFSGVWVGTRKIAAVGVKVTRGATKHGFALNVSPDLSYFSGIVPCGITDRGVTSVAELTDEFPSVVEAASVFEKSFAEVFGLELRHVEAVSM